MRWTGATQSDLVAVRRPTSSEREAACDHAAGAGAYLIHESPRTRERSGGTFHLDNGMELERLNAGRYVGKGLQAVGRSDGEYLYNLDRVEQSHRGFRQRHRDPHGRCRRCKTSSRKTDRCSTGFYIFKQRLWRPGSIRHVSYRRCTGHLLTGAVAAMTTTMANADSNWPGKPVTIVVPFAGGSTDAFARPLTATLRRRTSASEVHHRQMWWRRGRHSRASIAKGRADGLHLHGAVHHAIAPSTYPKLDYDIEKSFVPVALAPSVPQVIVVNPQRVAANDLGFHRGGEEVTGR